MRAGKLDRKLVIEVSTPAQDSRGQPKDSWATFATVWAEKVNKETSERYASEALHSFRTETYRTRWIAGVDEKMRVNISSVYYRIIGLIEVGRRRQLDIEVELIK